MLRGGGLMGFDGFQGGGIEHDNMPIDVVHFRSNIINRRMQLEEDRVPKGSVFIVRDCSFIQGLPLPSTAQVAEREGRILAKLLNNSDIRQASPSSFSTMSRQILRRVLFPLVNHLWALQNEEINRLSDHSINHFSIQSINPPSIQSIKRTNINPINGPLLQ